MKRLAMSRAAAGLLRAMLNRGTTQSDRILLTEVQSTDWQSLTFVGERHRFGLTISGTDAAVLFDRLTRGLSDAEFRIPGQIVADIGVETGPVSDGDGDSIAFTIEALTIAED